MYDLDNSGPILRFRLSGLVTIDDLQEATARVEAVEAAASRVPDRLADISTVDDFDMSYHSVFDLAQHRRTRTFPNRFRSAIVAATPLQRGFARMFQTLNDHPDIDVRIFGTEAEALTWLAADGETRRA